MIEVEPSHPGVWTNMGNVRLLQHRLLDAAQFYSRAASLATGDDSGSGNDASPQVADEAAWVSRKSGLHNLAQIYTMVRGVA